MTDVNAAPAELPDDTRSQILNAEVAKYAKRGWTVETVSAAAPGATGAPGPPEVAGARSGRSPLGGSEVAGMSAPIVV